MRIEFQPTYDTFTITFGKSANTVCFEDKNGILYRVDPKKDRILGITILGFSRRAEALGGFTLKPFFKVCESKQLKARCVSLRRVSGHSG